ncbi:MAG: sensor histidine kinase [Ignavibacteriaceae bacterium]
MHKKIFIKSLQAKFTIYFILFTLLMINTVGWLLYFQTTKYFDEELGNKLKSTAVEIKYLIQPDLLAYLVPGTEKGNFYQSLSLSLRGLKKSFDLQRVYLIDTTNKLLLDADTLKIIGSAIPHLQANLVELSEAEKGNTISTTLYRSYNGNLYKSAFSPIKNKNGKIIAIACIDASPLFLNVINKIEHFLFILNLISLITAILLSFLLARSITNPIKKLVSAAQRISSGNYNIDINISSTNEIGFLGNVFNAMQKNIRENESILKILKQRAENEADNIKSYNDLILQNVPIGILTIDLDGHLTVCNNEAESLLNINSSAIIYKHYSDIFNPDHPFRNIADKIYKRKEFTALLEEELKLGKKIKTLSIKVAPLYDSNKNLIGSNWLLVDLSDIKDLKLQIEEKKWLAHLGELSAGIAHEIRNPLNSISLYLGLLKREIQDKPRLIESIDKIQREIGNLNKIVADFLYFARPSNLNLEHVLVSDLFTESLFLASDDINQKHIKVRTDFIPQNISITCDKMQLKQAILNIVKNSIASMKDYGELKIKAYKSQQITIEILDNGEGIAEENLEKIFQPFFTTKRNGTGLGLAIVANIIKAHDGTISVNSKKNEGTLIKLNLTEHREN